MGEGLTAKDDAQKQEEKLKELLADDFIFDCFQSLIEQQRSWVLQELESIDDNSRRLALLDERKGMGKILYGLLSLRNSAKQEQNAGEESVNP